MFASDTTSHFAHIMYTTTRHNAMQRVIKLIVCLELLFSDTASAAALNNESKHYSILDHFIQFYSM